MIAGVAVLLGTAAYAQSAIDAYRLSQSDMKGTARYMSMAGAFGALGGDLSVLSHNPAGIGVYRNSDIGFTLDLDMQNASSGSGNSYTTQDQTKFLLNNIGFVWTLKLGSSTCPNLNFGFTYNKSASFNRRYRGYINLTNSLSNYIGAITSQGGYQEGQLIGDEYNNFDPYNPTDAADAAPWLSILGYDGYLISQSPAGSTNYVGQWQNGTTGSGYFDVQESGGIDSYNIAVGGNIANVVFWGMDFDISHINYTLNSIWNENLYNARVGDNAGVLRTMDSKWQLDNYYNCSGTGFNYKLGLIVKPIQELRIGFAFQTPTWYALRENFDAFIDYQYGNEKPGSVSTNDGYLAYNNVDFRSPWKLNASLAAVLFGKLIISGEYEWTQFKGMKYSTPGPWGGDYWYPDDYYPWDYPWDYPWYSRQKANIDPYVGYNDNYYYTNAQVQQYFRNTNTVRIGVEYKVLPQLSLRAGYSYVSSPVEEKTKYNSVTTAGTIPNYRLDNTTNYVTCGLGYRIKSFYIDLAYVYKHMNSEYYAFSPWRDVTGINYETNYIPSQTSSLRLNNSQVILSAGFKF